MKTALFDFPLPDRLIAQCPTERRDASRLLVAQRKSRSLEHRHFHDLPEYLRAGDCLVRNNAAVIPARLHATRPTGGRVECLLLRPAAGDPAPSSHAQIPNPGAQIPDPQSQTPSPISEFPSPSVSSWWCLLRPGKKLPVGATFGVAGIFSGQVVEKTGDGLARVRFETPESGILAVANRLGEMPLPPYIAERASAAERARDRERYQTVYADGNRQVAAAAPTAGLHFTPELLARLATQGVTTADLTLHVGLGTFRPIASEEIEDHAIHRETYEIGAATQRAILEPRGRRIAVGTTAVRTVEDWLGTHQGGAALCRDAAGQSGREALPPAVLAEAGLFIRPPWEFRGVDALITNFHQPRSTLLCLVAAFLAPGSTDGVEWLRQIYAEAVARDYRFFSYGDAMLIL